MLDIEQYLSSRFDRVDTYGRGITDLRIDCPFCLDRYGSDDTKMKCYISNDIGKQVVHCFRCGYSSSWIRFVMDLENCDYVHAYSYLYVVPKPRDIFNIEELLKPEKNEPRVAHASLPEDFIWLGAEQKSPLLNAARRYMRKRGFGYNYWKWYNIGIAGSVGMRVVIPIDDHYWQARAIVKWEEPKYVNPKVDSRDHVFNSDALKIYEEVVVAEGAFSAMAVGYNAIAIVGKESPDEKIERLLDSDVEHFILTIEPGAFPTMQRLADILQYAGRRVTLWIYSDGDPADENSSFVVRDYNFKTKVENLLNR